MNLTDRLEEIIRWVPKCTRVIDVGTDHALVPIALIARGVTQCGVGIDKSPLPLGKAIVNRHNAQQIDRLELLCANGLESLDTRDSDVVVMAGMGGRTMLDVLQRASWRGRLVVQPNSDLPLLRQWLYENGWTNDVETVIEENNQYFWTSRWSRVDAESPYEQVIEPLDLEFGRRTHIVSEAVFGQWFESEFNRLKSLPVQAPSREKMPLYVEMSARLRLSKSDILG